MRTYTARVVGLLVVLALAATSCGGSDGGGGGDLVRPPHDGAKRAREVADAWDGSEAAGVWRAGYYPTSDAVQLPADTFRNGADKLAYERANFVLRGGLPRTAPKNAQVRWEDGGSLTLPLLSARSAYAAMARGGSDAGRPHLTVTGARLGAMAVTTSRGAATVPAWLFTLEGYATPLRLGALRPSPLPAPPVGPIGNRPTGLSPLGGLVKVAGDGRSVTVVATHGACDDGPVVKTLETRGSVVLSASVVGDKEGPCTSELLGEPVTVTLDRPLGDRVLLDAHTGRPLTDHPLTDRPVTDRSTRFWSGK